jgi:chromatin assembly factor 1 subunit A
MTLHTEIVAFRTMLEERIRKQEPPLTTFPEEHKPLSKACT